MSDIVYKTATELARMIAKGDISSEELLNLYIDRIEKHDGDINAVVVRDFDRAREDARTCDTETARGASRGPLHGVPMTVKESFDVAGLQTCWGVPDAVGNIAQKDAVVIERLKAAGAVIFGKTNIPIMLQDFQSYNDVYGTTNNPHDLSRCAGGSSGGGAAALAAGFSALEYGSDIGGSIRNPAHYNGVYGHKPTWNLVPMRGHSLAGALTPSDLSVVGPLARSAEDLDQALVLTMGADQLHAGGWKVDMPVPTLTDLKGLKVALWLDDPLAPVDDSVKAIVSAAAQAMADAGAEIDPDARPDFDAARSHDAYGALLWSTLGTRQTDEAYAEALEKVANLSDDDTSKEANVARAMTLSFRDWARLNEFRTGLRWAWHRFFQDYDVLLTPMCVTAAFPHDHNPKMGARRLTVNGEERDYFEQLFWAGMTGVSLLPSTVMPGGMTEDNLPVGLHIVGPEMGDRKTITVAKLLSERFGGFQAPARMS